MKNKKDSSKGLVGTGIVTAIAASLCCITPLLAIIAGSSGIASSFSWLEPFRPFLIGITILVLGFAWYQKLKPQKQVDCDCEENQKPKFIQSKKFLGIVTVFAALMLAFPSFSHIFYPKIEKQQFEVNQSNIRTVEFQVSGMTCSGCEEHIKQEVNKIEGIIEVDASYEQENTIVKFDETLTNIAEIEKAINSTGYKVTKVKKTK